MTSHQPPPTDYEEIMQIEVFGLSVVSDRKAKIPFVWLMKNRGQREFDSLDLYFEYFRQYDPDYLDVVTEGSIVDILCSDDWSKVGGSSVYERFCGSIYLHGANVGYITLNQYREFDKILVLSFEEEDDSVVKFFRERFGISLKRSGSNLTAVVRK